MAKVWKKLEVAPGARALTGMEKVISMKKRALARAQRAAAEVWKNLVEVWKNTCWTSWLQRKASTMLPNNVLILFGAPQARPLRTPAPQAPLPAPQAPLGFSALGACAP